MAKEPRKYNAERTISSINVGETGQPPTKEWNWTTLSYTQRLPQNGYTYNTLAIKFLEGNIVSKLLDKGLGNNILVLTPKAKIKMWDYTKLKSLCTEKETTKKKWKGNLMNGRKYLQKICLIRDCYLKYMNTYNSIAKKQTTNMI